jgi:hypothetical protein
LEERGSGKRNITLFCKGEISNKLNYPVVLMGIEPGKIIWSSTKTNEV